MGKSVALRLIFVIPVAIILVTSSVNALSYPSRQSGQDISWPNCKTLKFTPDNFGIVGVNDGLSFSVNSCIGSEASLYKQNLSLYLNSGFPGYPYDTNYRDSPISCSFNNEQCVAYDYGYNSGVYAVNYALSEGVVTNNWWIDVETVNSWSANPEVNRNSLLGEVAAIRFLTKSNSIGFYSYPNQWDLITNNWLVNNPVWQATDNNIKTLAQKTCDAEGFDGQKPTLTQYLNHAETLDLDLSCS